MFFKSVLALSFLLSTLFSSSRAMIHLQKTQHDFTVTDMHGYLENVFLQGFSDEQGFYPILFNFSERINNVAYYTSTDGVSWSRIKLKTLVEQDAANSTFFNGLKMYSIQLNKNTHFRISYNIKCNEIMLLAELNIKNSELTDSVYSSIKLVHPLIFSWLAPLTDEQLTLQLDSSDDGLFRIYNFHSFVNNQKSSECPVYIYCNIHLPGITPEKELSNWFCSFFKQVDVINQNTMNETEKITAGLTDTVEIAKHILAFVKKSISYIDIEAGYGAFIPRKADDILVARKGDCKDMANLVYQMLKYKKITCYMGIMPTLSHSDDFIFPSLACANHCICVASIKNSWYFFDATDNENFFSLPSRHSQGRSVFCMRDSLPFVLTIPVVKPALNKTEHTIIFNISDTAISGTWEIIFNGHSSVNILDYINSFSQNGTREFFNSYFKNLAPRLKIISYNYDVKEEKVCCHIQFKTDHSMISTDEKKHYLSLKYLPAATPEMSESQCSHILYSTVSNNFNIRYNFLAPVHLVNAKIENAGSTEMAFDFASVQSDENTIMLDYTFKTPYLEYNKKLYTDFENIVSQAAKCFNNLIIYE